jgi:TonB family protein
MTTLKRSLWTLGLLFVLSPHLLAQTETPASKPGADEIFKGSDVTKRVRVTKKPEPKYTKLARKHDVEGTVVLRCVFSSTGEVKNIHVVSGLPDGLTERAIEAAQKIKFTPAIKDGRPVSMWMELQYNFNLY